MSKKKVSRREFLAKTSLAASAASVAGTAGESKAQEPEPDYAQSIYSIRAKALVSVLTRKNLIDPSAMDAVVDHYENKVGPRNGAHVVAR